MNIYFSDEDNRLNEEVIALMQKAGDFALQSEFKEELEEMGLDINDVPVDLSVSIVSGEIIKELNGEYRGIDKVTDVLSFPQFADADELIGDFACFEPDEEVDEEEAEFGDGGVLLGDVVICYDRAIEQAEEYGTGMMRELVYLFVHSIFHLFGYDHMEEDEKAVMRAREEEVLNAIGLSR